MILMINISSPLSAKQTISNTQTREPLDRLSSVALAQISPLGSRCTMVSQIIEQRDKAVYGAILKGINTANHHIYYDALVSVH